MAAWPHLQASGIWGTPSRGAGYLSVGSIKCETQRLIGKSRQHRPLYYHLQQAHSQRFKKGHKIADPYRPY